MRIWMYLLCCATALAAAAPARAGSDNSAGLVTVTDLGGGFYEFTQGGWSAGGTVTGTFTGFDYDNNGQLSSFFNEVTGFTMQFSGSSTTRAYTLGFSDFYGLVYNLDGGPLGDVGNDFGLVGGFFGGPQDNGIVGYSREGFAAHGATAYYVAGPGALEVCGGSVVCAFISASDDVGDGGGGGGGEPPSAAIPEPASWAMLIAGFGLTGAAMRRRRVVQVA